MSAQQSINIYIHIHIIYISTVLLHAHFVHVLGGFRSVKYSLQYLYCVVLSTLSGAQCCSNMVFYCDHLEYYCDPEVSFLRSYIVFTVIVKGRSCAPLEFFLLS